MVLSDFERTNYKPVIDEREVNSCVLKVIHLSSSATIEDMATAFPTAAMIKLEKSRTNKSKTAYIGYDSQTESVKAFVACHQIQIKGHNIVVTFADIYFEKRSVAEFEDI